jgi:ubiquinone/menaquinone biosynthesis C-methylase UbiE
MDVLDQRRTFMTNMVEVSKSQRTYLPAASYDVFLPFYDLIAKLLGADRARCTLLNQVPFRPGDHVLDIGCGTGTFAALLKQRFPTVEVIGLDPDPKALAHARRKAERAGLSIRFDQGFADTLEYPVATFDAIFSSFMFHHLEGDVREKTLREVRRVLKPGAAFYLLDFEVSQSSASGHGPFSLIHSSKRLRDNTESRILTLMGQAGFSDRKKIAVQPLLFGLGYAGCYRASTPNGEAESKRAH